MSFVNTVFISKNLTLTGVKVLKNLKKNRSFSINTINYLKNDDHIMQVFDRNTKSLQRERAASAQDANLYDYLKDEIGYRLADRVFDIKRKFKLAADIGKYSELIKFQLIKRYQFRMQQGVCCQTYFSKMH
jgi:hypothetical protein